VAVYSSATGIAGIALAQIYSRLFGGQGNAHLADENDHAEIESNKYSQMRNISD
jgi:hypothetical protein